MHCSMRTTWCLPASKGISCPVSMHECCIRAFPLEYFASEAPEVLIVGLRLHVILFLQVPVRVGVTTNMLAAVIHSHSLIV